MADASPLGLSVGNKIPSAGISDGWQNPHFILRDVYIQDSIDSCKQRLTTPSGK
jgi:hypothetical protein